MNSCSWCGEELSGLVRVEHSLAEDVHRPTEEQRVEHVGDELGQLVVEVPARGREEASIAPAVTHRSFMGGEPRRPSPKCVELFGRLDGEGFLIKLPGRRRGRPISRHGPDAVPAGCSLWSRRLLLSKIR